LREALAETLAGGGQSLLFLNRRGYAPLTLCRACGFRLACSACSAWLVAHRCAAASSATTAASPCPSRATALPAAPVASLVPSGPGVERLAEEVAHLLPDARWP
jgi:primosomal protein N' (replication factor Y)